jgi:hypothetical protein
MWYMTYALDQLTDYSYRELHSFLNKDAIPEFVKSAEVTTKEAVSELPDDAFADKYHRAFPINSAPDVYISNAFFTNKKAELNKLWGKSYVTDVEARITKAAELFNIQEDIGNYNTSLLQKEAADYEEKTLVSFDIGGNTYDLFPYKTAADIAHQANQFATNISNYPFEWRSAIACEFVKQAAELGVEELPDIICKYGGMFFPDAREFQETLERRMRKLSEANQAKYKECITKAGEITSREDAFKVCAEAYKVEKAAGVYEKPLLRREMGDIIDRTMVLSLKKIAEFLDVVKVGSDCYRIKDLQKISPDIYKQAFETEIDPTKTAELQEVLPTMPDSDWALFRELSGIQAC